MRAEISVSSIMTKNLIALTRSDDLERAELLFKRYKIRHMPVVSGETIIGMLSYTDLMRISYAETSSVKEDRLETVVYNNFTIEQVMQKDVVTISANTPIKEAAKILAEREFHALPVVEDGTLVGIVTTTDLLKYFIKQF
ncbi:acetoin utilization protein AcuB [Jejuia pallidilutea]|jgi:acetoin utilization protein AcuB|uniref:Acetoin utilization protein AcuB n=1 Tax=Jejuia pallidilutea TaxID=504487 RepID=A0A362X2T2_9FLAO|nr:CBS domain-containing protein [Jejuia pallidilutea]PQV51168.1 acetoin utilization protein AcuB [Jejuia pallidilutea]